MMEPAIKPVEDIPEEFESTALTVADEARNLRISNDVEYEAAGHFLRTAVKAVLKRADEIFDPAISAAHASHKAALAAKKEATADLMEAEKAVKRLMGQYAQEQERKRLAAEAEARREAEQKRREEAETLRAFGDEAEADAVEAAPVEVVAIEAAKPKAEGISVRKRWVFEVVDASRLRPEFLIPNEKAIQKVVTALGKDSAKAVGEGSIAVREESSVAVRV